MRTTIRSLISSIGVAGMLAQSVFAQNGYDEFPYIGLRTDPAMTVLTTREGSPARRAGLMQGDRIVVINGLSTQGVDHAKLVSSMHGALGTKLNLIIRRGEKQYSVSMTREESLRTRTRSLSAGEHQLDSAPEMQQKIALRKTNDARMIVVTAHSDLTQSVVSSVTRALDYLPPSTRKFFQDGGVTVVVASTPNEVLGSDGRSEYDPGRRRAIITERNTDGTATDFERLDIITLHELGHACDQLMGYPSRSAEFHDLYAREAPHVKAEDRYILSHFLQPGKAGPSESFASLFACKYYRGVDARLDALKANFPHLFAFVKRLREELNTENR